MDRLEVRMDEFIGRMDDETARNDQRHRQILLAVIGIGGSILVTLAGIGATVLLRLFDVI